jgi:hypothetical protein
VQVIFSLYLCKIKTKSFLKIMYRRRNNILNKSEYKNIYLTTIHNFFVNKNINIIYICIILFGINISKKYFKKSTAHHIYIFFLEIQQHSTCIFRLFVRQNKSLIAKQCILIIHLLNLRNMKTKLKQSCCMRMCRAAA